MKITLKFFVTIIILFVASAANHGICQTPERQPIPLISTQKIVDEISPFIDEDTAIVCCVNLVAFKEIYRLMDVTERLSKVESFHERIRRHFTALGQKFDRNNTEKIWKDISNMIENNVANMYVILNMRDLKFGAYFVIPDVSKNSDKAKSIEKFFEINNDVNNTNKRKAWSAYKQNYMIIVGNASILYALNLIYFVDEQLVSMLSVIPDKMNASCGYYNLSTAERIKYIGKRFETFKPLVNENFKRGMKEVEDCNLIKAVFLFPDSVIAWEFMHLKKMESPLNQVTFDFLKSSRDYIALGVDTEHPKIKLTAQCKSPEDAIKFKKLIDDAWRNIINNYFTYPLINPDPNKLEDGKRNNQKLTTPSEIADFFVSMLPKPQGDKLITIIDQIYKK